jgi:hypothetical protein
MFLPSGFGEIQKQARVIEPAISALEWRVAMLARRDAELGGWEASEPRFPRLRKLFAMLTGVGTISRLADERMEKLRLFLCMKRLGDRRADVVAADLLAMGFVPVALRKLEAVAVR